MNIGFISCGYTRVREEEPGRYLVREGTGGSLIRVVSFVSLTSSLPFIPCEVMSHLKDVSK